MSESTDLRSPIESLSFEWGRDVPERRVVGQNGVTKIEKFFRNGQRAKVPWYRVWEGDSVMEEVNAAYVISVMYEKS